MEVGDALGDDAIARGLPEEDPGQILAHDGAGFLVDAHACFWVHLFATGLKQGIQLGAVIAIVIAGGRSGVEVLVRTVRIWPVGPTKEGHLRLAILIVAGVPGGTIQRHQRDLDADVSQVGLDHGHYIGRELVVVIGVQHKFRQGGRINPRFGQQFFGLFGIVIIHFNPLGVILGIAIQAGYGGGGTLVDALDDRFAVDGVKQRLFEAWIGKGGIGLWIDRDRIVHLRRARDDDGVFVGRFAFEFVQRQVGEVNFAGIKGEQRGRRVFEFAANQGVDLGAAAPVVVKGGGLDVLAFHKFDKLEGAGANRQGAPVIILVEILVGEFGHACLLHDPGFGQRIKNRGVGAIRRDLQRVLINDDQARDGGCGAIFKGRSPGNRTQFTGLVTLDDRIKTEFNREDHVRSGKGGVVMPGDPWAQVEGPGLAVIGN